MNLGWVIIGNVWWGVVIWCLWRMFRNGVMGKGGYWGNCLVGFVEVYYFWEGFFEYIVMVE